VSAGKAFYGPGRTYHPLTACDASRAFCTGCLEPECLISSLADLTDAQLREADKARRVIRLRRERDVLRAASVAVYDPSPLPAHGSLLNADRERFPFPAVG
jgi:hypothetical protein